ncbi:polysaccharide deacetylase family protein [Reichenbachiella carrageenanivorans]|uniref:Polysaccharide deacetylase family protein n=1 Tax=Reichenbachiella carrageenanivorans TaxID=2979869 RepID=A0ABY6D4X8_9BACT|nr:polysaccharide deacetylase family protein [Reichenbachiella carrageenanivorans]UXX81222.1 polysaccharide deacetylase family protein [Reichenbachiella carrageenanivorans]
MIKYFNYFKKKIADVSLRQMVEIPSLPMAVSFTFDDVPKSGFVNAQKVLDEHQIKGTYYLALSFLEGRSENSDLYNIADLQHCVDQGHELACHTYSHIHLFETKENKVIEQDIAMNKQVLEALPFDCEFLNFSYPYGEQTWQAKKVMSKHFLTCRGIDPGINSGQVDTYNLKAIRLYENFNPLETIFSWLEAHQKNGGWLIFYTHDVQDDYSKHGCSPAYFETVVKKCIELKLITKTVAEVAKTLHLSKG